MTSSIHVERLDPRVFLSVATRDFDDDWKKAQAILSGEYFVALGDANRDRALSYDEQFAKNKSSVKDVNEDGRIDVSDLRTPDQTITTQLAEAIKYMDRVDRYEANRAAGAHAWVNADGVLAISGSGDLRVELSGGKYIKYTENGVQLARVTAKSVKRIEVFGGSAADNIRLGDTGKPAVVYARGGNDEVSGSGAGDTIYGGGGNDRIHGNGGDDRVYGGNGDDRLWGDGSADRLYGDAGVDRLDGGSGTDTLSGGSGTDYLTVRAKDKTDGDQKDKLSVIN